MSYSFAHASSFTCTAKKEDISVTIDGEKGSLNYKGSITEFRVASSTNNYFYSINLSAEDDVHSITLQKSAKRLTVVHKKDGVKRLTIKKCE